MKAETYISVVVYVHNEGNIIRDFLIRMDSILFENFYAYEIILVDDFSSDNSLIEIDNTRNNIKGNVMVLELAEKHGINAALGAGIDIAIGDMVYEIEYLNMNNIENVMLKMYGLLIQNSIDVVFGYVSAGKSLWKRIYHKTMRMVSSEMLDIKHTLIRLVTRKAINAATDYYMPDRHMLYKSTGLICDYYNLSDNTMHNKCSIGLLKKLPRYFYYLLCHTKFFNFLPFAMAGFISAIAAIYLFIKILSACLYKNQLNINWTNVIIVIGFSIIFSLIGAITNYLHILFSKLCNIKAYKVKNIRRIKCN